MNHQELAAMRRSYVKQGLSENDLGDDPYALFGLWLEQAIKTELAPYEANAMNLSTVDGNGRPHCRVLLLKDFSKQQGFVFFTNYHSAKAKEISANPYASMTFFWPVLERQVRIEGQLEKISAQDSDEYFYSRPLGSRIGAWASAQSQVIASREQLEQEVVAVQQRFNDQPPRPPHWGGYTLVAERFEFWQGRENRLHDRMEFVAQPCSWLRQRLAP